MNQPAQSSSDGMSYSDFNGDAGQCGMFQSAGSGDMGSFAGPGVGVRGDMMMGMQQPGAESSAVP
eukprot:scaffold543673_cov43-Prasinocladus_malaysianus.AAC.1